MLMPTVGRYMTPQPTTVSSHCMLAEAQRLMRERGVRHLPVVDEGQLVGILSERDLLRHEPGWAVVQEAMTERVYAVAAGAEIESVARTMIGNNYGSAVVVANDGSVQGIFTMHDACRALAEIVERAVA